MRTTFTEPYRPLYFLSALGMGGLSVSFFMYLMFLVPHQQTPIPTYESIAAVYRGDSTAMIAMTTIAILGIAWFAVRHLQFLTANLRQHAAFRRTAEYRALRSSNAEVTLMAIPLTLGMTINVAFILFALAVPGLWSKVEWLFPFSLVGFVAVGALAFVVFGRYLTRVMTHQNFDIEDTNHFSQVLPAFTFTMVAVGFAAPAAMSKNSAVSALAMIGSFIFLAAAAAWISVKLPISVASILRRGMAVEAGPTLWMGIPIFTLVGITAIRLSAGISHQFFHSELSPVLAFVIIGLLLGGQLVMGLLGWAVMRRQNYFARFVSGPKRSVPAYGLICPGVALAVLSMFFIHWGLVRNDLIARFSPTHLILLATVFGLQLLTIRTMARLNRKLYGGSAASESESTPSGTQVTGARA